MHIPRTGRPDRKAFNLIELLVVIGIIAVLASLLLPALNAAKAKAAKTKCINNLKQLAITWHLYMVDNADKMVSNGYGVPENAAVNPNGTINKMWVLGDEHNFPEQYTNVEYLTNPRYSLFAHYKLGAEIYKCPADRTTRELNGVQVERVRNYGLNLFFGWDTPRDGSRGQFFSQLLDTNYQQFHRESDLDRGANPSQLFTFVDMSPPSVCYAGFVTSMNPYAAWHRPNMEHQRYAIFAFADSHVETPRFMDKQTLDLAHETSAQMPLGPDPNWMATTGPSDGDHTRFLIPNTGANADYKWIRQRASVLK